MLTRRIVATDMQNFDDRSLTEFSAPTGFLADVANSTRICA
jgi:hypothetical protein